MGGLVKSDCITHPGSHQSTRAQLGFRFQVWQQNKLREDLCIHVLNISTTHYSPITITTTTATTASTTTTTTTKTTITKSTKTTTRQF